MLLFFDKTAAHIRLTAKNNRVKQLLFNVWTGLLIKVFQGSAEKNGWKLELPGFTQIRGSSSHMWALHRRQWHRYQVWSRAVASKNPLCALKSGQPSCHWGTCHWCGGSQRFKALSTNATYKSTHSSPLSRHFSLKPIYTTYGPQRSHLSTPPQVQGFWDKWLIRVAVLFLTTKKRKTNNFFKCFICYTGKYNLSP